MPKIRYIDKNFQESTLSIINQANEIIDEYLADDLKLTLRQLYYQFVARGLIDNKATEYDRLGGIINNGRLAGLIDWNAIEDRTRRLESNTHWKDPGEIIQACTASFQIDHWAGQEYRIEVWIEKEALSGVIENICQSLDVGFLACKGYVSQSEMWAAAMRLNKFREDGQIPVIIHLGDHDPSGIDMTRDIFDRQGMFYGAGVIKRIALTMDQIEIYTPPPFFAKVSDSRFAKYVSEYGNDCWELDALEPKAMRNVIRDAVLEYRDEDVYQQVLKQEQEYLSILENIEENWESL